DQELRRENLTQGGVVPLAPGATARLEQPDLQHLTRVVPLVDGVVDVEALIALEPDQPRAEDVGEHLGDLGLADSGLAFEEERLGHLEGEEERGCQTSVGDVAVGAQGSLHRVNGGDGRLPILFNHTNMLAQCRSDGGAVKWYNDHASGANAS